MHVGQMPAHLERRDKSGGHQGGAKPARHVDELRVGPGLGLHLHGLQCHPANRAGARRNLPDLGMHGTGIDGALRNRLGGATVAVEVCGRRCQEPHAATARTEIVAAAIEGRAMCRCVRIDIHSAHRILVRVGYASASARASARARARSAAELIAVPLAHATGPMFVGAHADLRSA